MKVNKRIFKKFLILSFFKKILSGKDIWPVGEKYVMNVIPHFLIIITCVNNVVIWFVLNVQINSHN